MKVNVECSACGGTGLYSGMCEGEGCAVICLGCSGSGMATLTYKPFTHRKKMAGANELKISKSRGTFIGTGVGAVGASMSYAEFVKLCPAGKVES